MSGKVGERPSTSIYFQNISPKPASLWLTVNHRNINIKSNWKVSKCVFVEISSKIKLNEQTAWWQEWWWGEGKCHGGDSSDPANRRRTRPSILRWKLRWDVVAVLGPGGDSSTGNNQEMWKKPTRALMTEPCCRWRTVHPLCRHRHMTIDRWNSMISHLRPLLVCLLLSLTEFVESTTLILSPSLTSCLPLV